MGAFWVAKDAKFFHAPNKDSGQTLQMCRLNESLFGTHVRRYVFSCCGSNVGQGQILVLG